MIPLGGPLGGASFTAVGDSLDDPIEIQRFSCVSGFPLSVKLARGCRGCPKVPSVGVPVFVALLSRSLLTPVMKRFGG